MEEIKKHQTKINKISKTIASEIVSKERKSEDFGEAIDINSVFDNKKTTEIIIVPESKSYSPSNLGAMEKAAIYAVQGKTIKVTGKTKQVPGSFKLQGELTVNKTNILEDKLSEFTNSQLRFHTIATRDAYDLSDNNKEKIEHHRAYRIMLDIAERRGLNLETGIHNPSLATDPDLALTHRDSASIKKPRRGFDREVMIITK